MRLVVDARMLGYSGIGTYVENVLPGVLSRCARLNPVVIAAPGRADRIAGTSAPGADIVTWNAPPLSWHELSRPPMPAGSVLWWAPHFNVPIRCRVPLVVTLHDLLPLVDKRTPLVARIASRIWLSRIRKMALRVMCDSAFTRRHAIELARIDPGITSIIPLGVRVPLCVKTSSTPPYLLFVGILKPHKNVAGLVRAFRRISARIPHRLVLVVRRSGLRGIDQEALAEAMSFGGRIDLLENISDETLSALMCGADLLIQPSFSEGFGLPPLEAMATGTPVLAARAGALPEVCGDAAMYCDPGSDEDIAVRILEILGDSRLRARLSAAGRVRAARYTWERCAKRTAETLLDAAAASRAVRAL